MLILPIPQDDLKPLIETARCLQVKGLSMAQPNVVPPSHNPATPRKRPHSQMIFPDKAKEARRLKVAAPGGGGGPPRPLPGQIVRKVPRSLPGPSPDPRDVSGAGLCCWLFAGQQLQCRVAPQPYTRPGPRTEDP